MRISQAAPMDLRRRAQLHQIIVLDLFPGCWLTCAMTAISPLRAATADEVAESLAFALRYDGRRRVHDADHAMGRITADRLVRHLLEAGFVITKAPPGTAPTTSHMPPPSIG